MTRRLREASFQVVQGQSVVVPLIIEGLPGEIEALGTRWLRKVEFHVTLISARVVDEACARRADRWGVVTRTWSGRDVGEILVRDEVRRVSGHSDRPDLETLVVMADVTGLEQLYRDLSGALAIELAPPPTHVTLYSTDPTQGIGIDDAAQLARRAPAVPAADQASVRQAIGFDDVFG